MKNNKTDSTNTCEHLCPLRRNVPRRPCGNDRRHLRLEQFRYEEAILLIPPELVKSSRDSVRKAREAYLIERGQTLEPHGLNKKDETLY